MTDGGFPGLWDWRRRIADLYAAVRSETDPAAGWRRWQDTRNLLFRTHPQSPIDPDRRDSFAGLRHFKYDPALRFTATLLPAAGAGLDIPVGEDGTVRLSAFARTAGLAGALGAELTLYWLLGYGGGVFLPFTDATCGESTYGGGRYLLDTIKGADLGLAPDGRAILDFNFAYAPSCAHSGRYICPLAPRENRLPGRVCAGERLGV